MGYKPHPSRVTFIYAQIFAVRVVPRQMIVLEFKAKEKTNQYSAIDEVIRTAQYHTLSNGTCGLICSSSNPAATTVSGGMSRHSRL
jgi:putative transposase